MFRHFIVKNFRCFGDLHLNDLARVNLIAGKNNAGKTAMLEALYLIGNKGDSRAVFDLNRMRGIPAAKLTAREQCSWLFLDKDTTRTISMQTSDDNGKTATLETWLFQRMAAKVEKNPSMEEMIRQLGQRMYLSGFPFLASRFATDNGSQRWCTTLLDQPLASAEITAVDRPKEDPRCLFLSPSDRFLPHFLEFFSQIEAEGRQEEVLTPLQCLDHRLQRITLLVLEGEAGLYGEVGRNRLVPFTFMGEGFRRAAFIVLAIANVPGGVVLIDEIENGLHYSVQEKVWAAIAETARRLNVQIFATTHSWECIEAAHRAFKKLDPYELRFYRLDRKGDKINVKSFDERMLDTVEKSDLEVR